MRNLYALIFTLDVIFDSIEISSAQSSPETRDFLSNFGKSNEHTNRQDSSSQVKIRPNDDRILGVARSGTTHFPEKRRSAEKLHPPDRYLPYARPHFPSSSVMSLPPAQPLLLAKSRSLPAIEYPIRLSKLSPEQLRLVRLIPHSNLERQFEIRRFTFPPDKPMQLRGKNQIYGPMRTEKQNVLSTPDGDIFAIVEHCVILRGMYIEKNFSQLRAKINMNSKLVTEMTPEEIRETPLGSPSPISKNFGIVIVTEIATHH